MNSIFQENIIANPESMELDAKPHQPVTGLFKLGWGFTKKCNMSCIMCYSSSIRSVKELQEASLSQCVSFAVKNAPYLESINFGTGENSLSKEWYRFVRFCSKKLNAKLGVTTNGWLGIETKRHKFAEEVIVNSINDIDVSIDHYCPSIHNRIRGHPKAFDWALLTLEFCKEFEIEVSVVTCLMRENCNMRNIEGLFKIAEKFETNLRLNIFRPVTEWSKSLIIPPRKLYTVLLSVMKNHNIVRISDPLFSGLLQLDHCIGDTAGLSSCRITPDGSITPSTYLFGDKWIADNISNLPLLPDIRYTKPFSRLINSEIPQQCSKCNYSMTCQGGAKDRRILWYNSLDKPDPYCPLPQIRKNPFEKIDISFSKKDAYLVHDNYLPTLIFAP